MRNALLPVIVLAAIATAGCTSLERSRALGDPAVAAQSIAMQVCSNCHGVDGNSVSPNFPKLAGQTEAYLTDQLKEFRNHRRADPAGFEYMWGLSRHLSDDQIAGLASYYAAQKPAVPTDPGGAPSVRGEALFEHGVPDKGIPACSGCHGKDGQGNDKFPRIANQHADYLVKQLMVFQRTDERPEGAIMKTVAHELTVDDMAQVARFLEAMPIK
jgi:cytochrome c553